MTIREKKNIIKLTTVLVITTVVMIILSIPLISIIAPLGNILFPGTGVWNVPGEVPQHEKLYVPGLNSSVTIYRDEWGIPHIYANTEEDMSFALGYVHAQDRLFQMDLARRQVRGKLSEVVGELALEEDKFNLAIGMEYWANETLNKAIELQESGEIDYLDSMYSYADGVNYYINTHQKELPIEYAILGFKPAKWTPLDTFCFSKFMSRMLAWQYNDLYRLQTIEALGEANFNELFTSTYGQIPICPNYGSYNDSSELLYNEGALKINSKVISAIKSFLGDIEGIPYEKDLIEARKENLIGSNNWVVDGVKSSTGKPILSNDMHLSWNMPGIWYEAHLVSKNPDTNIYGFTLAGVPIPIVGHNEYVAWGITSTIYDVMDWFFYEETDSNHYVYNGSNTEYTKRTYNIKVKGQDTYKFTVKETVHGPVLNDFLGGRVPDSIEEDKIVLAPKWTGNNITTEFRAIYGYMHAKNRTEFNKASSYFDTPPSNMVYADIDGHIAIRPTGLVPIRDDTMIPSGHLGNGTLPYNGSNGEGEWIDYVPFNEIPNTEDPSQHYLASANQIVVGPDYKKYSLQNGYAAGYRARRINELLNNSADGTVGVEKMKEIQLDIKSTPARAFVPFLINVIEDLPLSKKGKVILDVLTQLKNWDYDMDRDLAAPTIYRKWRDFYFDYTFNDEFNAAGAPISPQLNVLEKLTKEEPNSKWFDDINTPGIENRTHIVIRALNSTIDSLLEFYKTDEVNEWRWGELHQLLFPHLAPGLDSFNKGPYEGDGEGYTVNPAGANIRNGVGYARGGASERFIVEFSDLQNCLSVIPSGQRAISSSKHYSDQLEDLFLQGKFHWQYFYNDKEDFPETHIESQLFLIAKINPNIILLQTTFLIVSFSIGIICVVIVWRKKDFLLSKFNALKSKIRSEKDEA
ncbi:MAG: penicillin acylase family protein [Promethearchaeota archaeon]|jgi:penicillin amidase